MLIWVVSTMYLEPLTKIMSVLLLLPTYYLTPPPLNVEASLMMALLAIDTSREAAKSILFLNRLDSTKKEHLEDYFFHFI